MTAWCTVVEKPQPWLLSAAVCRKPCTEGLGCSFGRLLAVILVKVLGTVSLGRDKCCPCQ